MSHLHKRLAAAHRDRFNCCLCHAEMIRGPVKAEKVACNKWCSVTCAMCYFTGCLTETVAEYDEDGSHFIHNSDN